MFQLMQDTKLAQSAEAAADAVGKSLTVNGEAHRTCAANLLELLADLGYGTNRVATAVNGEFVPERLRAQCRLAAGDEIEIVAPRQGG